MDPANCPSTATRIPRPPTRSLAHPAAPDCRRSRASRRRAPSTPRPGVALKIDRDLAIDNPRLRAYIHHRAGQRMLGSLLDGRRQAQPRIVDFRVDHARLALRHRPVLSSTSVFTRRSFSSASPPLISRPISAPRPVATITAVGTASPIAHGHAMISTATARRRRFRQLRARQHPRRETSRRASATTTGTNTPLMRSASRSMGARERLRLPHQRHDARQHARFAERRRPITKTPGRIHACRRSPGSPSPLLDRRRLAREHRFVHVARPVDDLAIHRKLFPGAHDDQVATANLADGQIDFSGVAHHPSRRRA